MNAMVPRSLPSPKAAVDDMPRAGTSTMIESRALFKGHREILIRHGQDIYRLRQTQAGKLMLTK